MTVSKTIQFSKVESITYKINEQDISHAIILLLREKFPEDNLEYYHQAWHFEYGDTDSGETYCEAVRRITKETQGEAK
jgi:hypothetical protein